MNLPPEVHRFLDVKRIELGASPHTLDAYHSDLADFCRSLRGKSPLKALENDVNHYLRGCSERELAPATIARRISVLREFYKEQQRDRRIKHDPMRRVQAPKAWQRIPKAISETDARSLLEFPLGMFHNKVLGLRDRAIIELFWAAGLRVSELAEAKLADLDLEGRSLLVLGKGSKERMVPFGQPAARALREYLAESRLKLAKQTPSRFLFISKRGGQLTRQRVWQMIKARAAFAGLTGLSPHGMRHTCASHLVENGADLRVVQEILGHADISTTERYLRAASPARLRAVLAACHPRSTLKHRQMGLFTPKASVQLGYTMCSLCISPAVEGLRLCERHRVLARDAQKKFRAKKKSHEDRNRRRA